jgi:hypothetical protein
MPKLCRECDTSKLLINGATVTWICKKSGHHKNFVDTCDLTKNPTTPHPLLGTLDSYIEAARCKVLTEFQKMHQK